MTKLATVNELEVSESNNSALAAQLQAGGGDEWFEKKFNEQMEKYKANKTPSMAIVVTKGSLDWAYPPFILASSAAELGWDVPNAISSNIPGFEKAATGLMKQTMANKGVAAIEELRELSLEAGVEMIACQMTVDLFGYDMDEFVPEVADWVGAASFLPTAQEADVTLFI